MKDTGNARVKKAENEAKVKETGNDITKKETNIVNVEAIDDVKVNRQ